MRSGSLRHRIIIQRVVPVKDALTGNITPTPETFATVWADKRPTSAREFILAGASGSKVNTVITIRYIEGIKVSMRIVCGGDTFNIEGVLPDAKSGKEFLTLPCSEVKRG